MQVKFNALDLVLELGFYLPHLSLQTLDGQLLVSEAF